MASQVTNFNPSECFISLLLLNLFMASAAGFEPVISPPLRPANSCRRKTRGQCISTAHKKIYVSVEFMPMWYLQQIMASGNSPLHSLSSFHYCCPESSVTSLSDFWKSFQQICQQKEPKKMGDFWGHFEKIKFCKNCNFWIYSGYFFIQVLIRSILPERYVLYIGSDQGG